MKKRIPHGISNFERLISENYFYVDRTVFLQKMEEIPNPYQVLLRPRKFGKSLFLSMMQYYYGVQYKEKFQALFGEFYIGENPTPLRNSFYVIVFDFSGVQTFESGNLQREFTDKVASAIRDFAYRTELFSDATISEILSLSSASMMMQRLLDEFIPVSHGRTFFILVDEYDHFTNELLSFNRDLFDTSVSQNGFVRKFFEVIKTGTRNGVVGRFFATGVTPVTLDSMTSGFNVAKNLTLEQDFNDMLGFTEPQLQELLTYYDVEDASKVLEDMRYFYNGSCFAPFATGRLYNSHSVLYFLDHLTRTGRYPDSLTDSNLASDYGKISAIVNFNPTSDIQSKLNELINSGETTAKLTEQFSFMRPFTSNDFVSLLFYNGLVTIKENYFGMLRFSIPNYAIRELYWGLFAAQILNASSLTDDLSSDELDLINLGLTGDIVPFVKKIEEVLQELSRRDSIHFDEKYIKLLFVVFAQRGNKFIIRSEMEVAGGFIDLLLLDKKDVSLNFQFMFEFKYLKLSDAHLRDSKMKEALDQLKRYSNDAFIQSLTHLKKFAIVFVGSECTWVEVQGES